MVMLVEEEVKVRRRRRRWWRRRRGRRRRGYADTFVQEVDVGKFFKLCIDSSCPPLPLLPRRQQA